MRKKESVKAELIFGSDICPNHNLYHSAVLNAYKRHHTYIYNNGS